MRIILVLVVLLSLLPYGHAQTQVELTNKTKIEYENTDNELNRVYKKVLENYKKDPVFIKMLRDAQRAWISYRNAQIKMKFPTYANNGGSVLPMCYYNYMKEITDRRVFELTQWLNGVDEGDVCSGSIKISK